MKDTPTMNGKTLLDAESFQKLLAAAYVLQEHNDQLLRVNTGMDRSSTAAAQPQPEEHFDQPELAESAPSDYTETLAEIVAIQQQIQMSHMDLSDAMHVIAGRARHITRAAGAAIGLVEESYLVYRAASGSTQDRIGARMESGSCLSARCLKQGDTVRCPDVSRDSGVDRALCGRYGIKALVAVPIFYEGKIVGSLELHFSAANAFQGNDVRTAQLMAGLVTESKAHAAQAEWRPALATERATMLDALTRFKPELEQLQSEPKTSSGKNGSAAAAPVAKRVSEEVTCIECGNQLEADVLFCGQCGTERPTPPRGDVQSKYAPMWHISQARGEAGNPPAGDRVLPPPMDRQSFASTKSADSSSTAHDFDLLPEPDGAVPQTVLEDSSRAEHGTAAEDTAGAVGLTKHPWSSASKAKEWLDLQRRPAGAWHWWTKRRADIYLAVALVVVIAAIGWLVGAKQSNPAARSGRTATSSGNGVTTPPPRRKPPEPQLTMFEKMLVAVGLAEPPPAPVYSGNPSTQVWVDLHTALYYCPGADLYGKTPKGKFTSQRDAQLDQFEPAYRKACD
jgi:GAF domain-containing protein